MKTASGKGFQPTLPTKEQITAISYRFRSIISTWRTHKLKVVFAYLNALTYRACRQSGVLKRVRRAEGERKGFHRIVGSLKSLVSRGISGFNITIEGIANQLLNFWRLEISEASLRKYRYELRDVFDLFWFDSQPMPIGDIDNRNARRPPMLQNFDLPLACILLEALEDVLVRERGVEIEEFPGCAALCRFIYNKLFNRESSYRRKRVVEDVVVMSQGEEVVYASEMDWHEHQLTEEGARYWYGSDDVTLIPDDDGLIPELAW